MESIELQVAPQIDAPGKMKLLLVHGAHAFEFAAVRCYYDDENGKTTYSTVVANIEKWKDDEGGLSQWTDEEPITPAPIELRPVPVRASDTGR
jgi:isopentenyl phosphate kinase